MKTPYDIHLKNEPLFAFAGLYDTWRNPGGATSCPNVVITTVMMRRT